MKHPIVGDLDLTFDVFSLPADTNLILAVDAARPTDP